MARPGRKPNPVDDFLRTDFSKPPRAQELYYQFIEQSLIEKCKEEDEVLRRVMRGEDHKTIIEYLKNKHPGMNFNKRDFEKFLARNREVVRELESSDDRLKQRHLLAREDCAAKLYDVAVMAESLIREYHDKEDHKSTLTALKVLNSTLMNYSKILGYTEKPEKKKEEVVELIPQSTIDKAKLALEADYKLIEDAPED